MGLSFIKQQKKDFFAAIPVVITIFLVIFSVVPNSFSVSLIGVFFSFLWMFFKKSEDNLFLFSDKNKFLFCIYLFLIFLTIAACLHAYLRTYSPGYDLAWFAQAITNVKNGDILRITSERPINHLVQHWEPILLTATPLTYIFSGAISIVLWQSLALLFGTFAAWKISHFLFDKSKVSSLKYLTTILFFVSWINVNPILFDAHPPVFGTLLFFPWIFYFIITNKNKYIVFILLFLLAQCGEIFFAIIPTYFVYYILKYKVNFYRVIISILIYFSGFVLVGAYQRYFGPWVTGDAFPFAGRYAAIGGDGIGILSTFLKNPLFVLSHLLTTEKIIVILKIFTYCGPFAFLSVFSRKYRLISICIAMGCVAYFIQAGLSNGMSSNTHYISSLGTQWWLLTVIGIYYCTYEYNGKSFLLRLKNFIFSNKKIVPFFMILYFLNTSEWRKSLLYPFRESIEREQVPQSVRAFLSSLPKMDGVLFSGTEWLCPLVADERKWLLCEGHPNIVLPLMPLNIVVANVDSLKSTYNNLSREVKRDPNAVTLNALINDNPQSVGWEKVGDFQQYDNIYSSKSRVFQYSIWKKRSATEESPS